MTRIPAFVLAMLLLALCGMPLPALAQTDMLTQCVGDITTNCAIVTGITTCVSNTIYTQMGNFLAQFSAYMQPVAAAAAVVAVIMTGFHFMLGEQHVTRRALGAAFRIALVLVYSNALGGLMSLPFDIMNAMISWLAGGSPWGQLDAAIATLVDRQANPNGSQTPELFNGILGILGGGLFSSSSGIFMFFLGLAVLLALMNLLLRAIWTYLLAFLMIAFLVIISPLVIIAAMFRTSEERFRKWSALITAAILQPVLLFGFLSQFFGLVNQMVMGVLGLFGGDMSMWERNNNPLSSWGLMTDYGLLQQYQQQGLPAGTPISQSFIGGPIMGSTTEMNMLQLSSVDLGLSGNSMVMWQAFINQFLALGIVCFIMTALVDLIPELADGIAEIATTIGSQGMERMPLMDDLKSAISSAMQRVGGKG